jgi:hypothetical protein
LTITHRRVVFRAQAIERVIDVGYVHVSIDDSRGVPGRERDASFLCDRKQSRTGPVDEVVVGGDRRDLHNLAGRSELLDGHV